MMDGDICISVYVCMTNVISSTNPYYKPGWLYMHISTCCMANVISTNPYYKPRLPLLLNPFSKTQSEVSYLSA